MQMEGEGERRVECDHDGRERTMNNPPGLEGAVFAVGGTGVFAATSRIPMIGLDEREAGSEKTEVR